MTRGRILWLALGVAVVASLAIAVAGSDGEDGSPAARADAIASSVRCPTCAGQSVTESAAPAAQAIRAEIRRRVDAGESRREIEAYLQGRYGSDILLTPPRSGIGGLVWVIPVVAVFAAAGALWVALQRWSRRPLVHPTEEDRALVERST
jgi:cytochrome c-type biogenesis protein CcmH/NrfF